MFSEYSKQTDTSRQSDCLRDEMFSAATIEAIRGGGGGGGRGYAVAFSVHCAEYLLFSGHLLPIILRPPVGWKVRP